MKTIFLLLLGGLVAAAAPAPVAAKPPNIIFILADDLGFGDLNATLPTEYEKADDKDE